MLPELLYNCYQYQMTENQMVLFGGVAKDSPTTTSTTRTTTEAETTTITTGEPPHDACYPHEYLMVTAELGGLGNQMSQYATLLAASAMAGYTPRICEVCIKLSDRFLIRTSNLSSHVFTFC